MNRNDSLIKEYVSADETARLHLFLVHRDLRDCFIRIDMAALRRLEAQRPVRPAVRWVERLRQLCPACSKV